MPPTGFSLIVLFTIAKHQLNVRCAGIEIQITCKERLIIVIDSKENYTWIPFFKLKSVVLKRNLLSCLKFYTTKLKTYSAYSNTKFQYYESNSLLQLRIHYPAKLLRLAHVRFIKINSVLCLFTNIYPENNLYKLRN